MRLLTIYNSENTSMYLSQGNNDDVILSCCLHFCKDKAKDFMPSQRSMKSWQFVHISPNTGSALILAFGNFWCSLYTDGTVRLHREVVLLTDDRNLRVKALTRNVPVRDIPAFLSWAKVGWTRTSCKRKNPANEACLQSKPRREDKTIGGRRRYWGKRNDNWVIANGSQGIVVRAGWSEWAFPFPEVCMRMYVLRSASLPQKDAGDHLSLRKAR